jgi:predicted nucleic acid-binding protein
LAKRQQPLGITPIVWLEAVEGAQNTRVQQRVLAALQNFGMVYLTPADFDWAMQQTIAFGLSHNVGMMDCLIASVSYRLQSPLYTKNIKHFAPLLGALAQNPY